METRYKKVRYLYGKDKFFLYTPMLIEVVDEKKDSNHNLISLTYIEQGGQEWTWSQSYPYEIVKSFTPSDTKMLVSDYRGKTITAYHFIGGGFPDVKHESVNVLVEKRGSYTMLQCNHCGKQSPIAINSMYVNGDVELETCKNDYNE